MHNIPGILAGEDEAVVKDRLKLTRLSLLIPAYQAVATLPQLVCKLLAQADDAYPIEIVISVDDGQDYRSVLPADLRIRYAEEGFKSGPAIARNRTLAAATGSHVCPIDADDDVSDLFLATVFHALRSHDAFALRTTYVKGGVATKTFHGAWLVLDDFVRFYGSVPFVAPKTWLPHYQDVVAEDGLATMAVMHRNGGRLPVVNAEYRIMLHSSSYCAAHGHEFTAKYQGCLERAAELAASLGDLDLLCSVRHLYETRLQMSAAYDAHLQAGGGLDYHNFTEQIDRLVGLLYSGGGVGRAQPELVATGSRG